MQSSRSELISARSVRLSDSSRRLPFTRSGWVRVPRLVPSLTPASHAPSGPRSLQEAAGPLAFSYYLCARETLTLRLFRNRALLPSTLAKPFLAPDIREYDYLLQVQGGADELAGIELLDRLTALVPVRYASEIDPYELKYKDNFFF